MVIPAVTNVLLVTIDSLRADHVGCYGYERETTPTIDALAADGLSFDAFANSNWTRASFPSIITSTYPLEYGGFEYLSDDRTTVGQAFDAADYDTAAFHSNLWLSRDYNYDRGFDHFYDSKSNPGLLSRLRTAAKLRLDHDSVLYNVLQWLYDTTEEKAGIDVGQTYNDAETMTDEVIDWLDGAQEPFFAWVHYMDVHHPYVPHEDALDSLDIDLNLNRREAIQLRRKMLESTREITESERQQLLDLYDGEIRYTDEQIGRLVDAVEQRFDREETAYVVTSDHGEEFLEHGRFSHNHGMYDEVLKVPIVVNGADRVRGVEARGHQSELVELLDVAPTCCALAGVSTPKSYRGRSLLEVAASREDATVFSQSLLETESKISARTQEWKFIWNRETEERELYDIETDPEESENLVSERTGLVEEFESRVEEHLNSLRDTDEALPKVEMDNETEDRLKNLGYLE
jgi:arylsulfatase A-like enzyme